MPLRVTFQFASNAQAWNEIWYYTKSSSFSDCVRDIQSLPPGFMVNWRSYQTICTRVRINDVVSNRKGLPLIINLGGTVGTSASARAGDVQAVASIFSVSTAGGNTKRVWLRGLPDYQTRRDPNSGLAVLDPAMGRRIETYLNNLRSIDMGIRWLTSITPDQWSPILRAQRAAAGAGLGIDLVLGANAPVANGRVIVANADKKLAPALNGHYYGTFSAGPILTIPWNPPATWPASGTYVNLGTKAHLRAESYNYNTLSTFGYIDTWIHKTGKNPAGHRGRAPAGVRRAQ